MSYKQIATGILSYSALTTVSTMWAAGMYEYQREIPISKPFLAGHVIGMTIDCIASSIIPELLEIRKETQFSIFSIYGAFGLLGSYRRIKEEEKI